MLRISWILLWNMNDKLGRQTDKENYIQKEL